MLTLDAQDAQGKDGQIDPAELRKAPGGGQVGAAKGRLEVVQQPPV
jgi:hypothetical protein